MQKIVFVLGILLMCNTWAASSNSTSIQIITGSPGIDFNRPSDVTVDLRGRTYVADPMNSVVHVFDKEGKALYQLKGQGRNKLVMPWAVATDGEGLVYVTDIGNNMISVFSQSGDYLVKFGGTGDGNGRFNMPFDIAVAEDGNIFVVDTGNNIVQIIKGRYRAKIGGSGSREGQFSTPTSITIGRDGYVYVTDSGNSRVQVFSQNGVYLKKFGGAGSGPGEFSKPEGVVMGNENVIYVSDGGNSRIEVFDRNNEFLFEFGNKESVEPQLKNPGQLFYNAESDQLFVLDIGNSRLLKIGKIFQQYARCGFCHKQKEFEQRNEGNVHPPFKEDCARCHQRHGDDNKLVLTREGNELCYGCHDLEEQQLVSRHRGYPIDQSQCIECHDPHTSPNEKLLRGRHIVNKEVDCSNCHDWDDDQLTLKEEKSTFCFICHSIKVSTVHSVYQGREQDIGCKNCHGTHGSAYKRDLLALESRVCEGCHDLTQKPHKHVYDVFPSNRIEIDSELPVGKKGKVICYTCHSPHYSRNKYLLRFDKGELCIRCHGGM